MKVASLKFWTLFAVVVVLILAAMLGLLLIIRTTLKKDAKPLSGILSESWQRYDLPEGKACGAFPAEPGAWVVTRPNGEVRHEFTTDYDGRHTYTGFNDQPLIGRLPFITHFVQFRAADAASVGKDL